VSYRQLCRITQIAEKEPFSKKSVPVTGVMRW